MNSSLQSLALKKCFETNKQQLFDSLDRYALPSNLVDEVRWMETKGSWKIKNLSISTKYESNITGSLFLTTHKILSLFQNGVIQTWDLLNNKKDKCHLDFEVENFFTSSMSIVYVAKSINKLLLADKESPNKILSQYSLSNEFRDGRFIGANTVAMASKSEIVIYDIREKKLAFRSHLKGANFFYLANSGESLLYLSSKECSIKYLDLRKPEIQQFVRDKEERLSHIEVIGKQLLTSSYLTSPEKILIWDGATGSREGEICVQKRLFVSTLSVDKSNNLLCCGTQDGYVQVWDFSHKKKPYRLFERVVEKGYPIITSELQERQYVIANRTGDVAVGCL